ncbi:MAG: hypothetical protein ACFNLO_04755 [Selenomonas massiliensis]
MFNKKSSRHSLALFVALALGSGALLAPSATGAADVNGQNVAIDDTHAPSDNAIAPGGGPAFGTAAGFIKEEANSGNVTGNTLTFKNINYMKQLYGGLTFGTGNVTGNKVFVNPATGTFFSNTDGIFGGNANGGGNVEYNHAEFNGNQLNGDLVGGMTKGTGTGIVKGNTALLKGQRKQHLRRHGSRQSKWRCRRKYGDHRRRHHHGHKQYLRRIHQWHGQGNGQYRQSYRWHSKRRLWRPLAER